MKTLLALVKKEMLQVIRDPSSILIAFILPLILLFIYGYGVNLDSNRIRLGLIMEDSTPEIVSLATAFTNSRFLDIHAGYDRRELEQQIISGKLRGLIVIPQDFSVNTEGGELPAPIQVIADGSEPNIASFVHNYTQGVASIWLQHQLEDQGISVAGPKITTVPRVWFNEELQSRNFLLPGSIAIIMSLIGTLLTALVVAREWERGTMEALMATPVSIYQILLGKLITYFLLALCSMGICWFVTVFWYGVPFRGSFAVLLGVTSVFLFAALGQGLLISALSKNQFLASQFALITAFLPAFMLSGFIFEISSMPTPLQWLTKIFAARYFVSCLQTLFLTGTIYSLLASYICIMALIGVAFFILTAKKTVKRIDA